jgi:stage V sporulation protein AC
MNEKKYKNLVDKITPKDNKTKNALIAFFVGGLVGLLGEFIINILMCSFGLSRVDSYAYLAMIIIFLASLFTAFGFFDSWVSFSKAGLFLPTTGFAHSIASCALDYKKDGLITGVGSNFFKLAGSVIVYGILSAFLLLIVRMIIGV